MTGPPGPPDPPAVPDERIAAVYDELRGLAAAYMRRERSDHTLQPTALVNEAWLRLGGSVIPGGRTHFLALAATVMRRVLIDYARARGAAKRGGGWSRVTVSEAARLSDGVDDDVIAVDEALTKLAALDPRAARIVELRFFAGLTEAEIAAELGISERWVRDQWRHARAWLRRAMLSE
jgi:RNA polymerase sigma factor (TIGR02999 family)